MWMSHGDKLHKVPEGFKKVGMFVSFSFFCEHQSDKFIQMIFGFTHI